MGTYTISYQTYPILKINSGLINHKGFEDS